MARSIYVFAVCAGFVAVGIGGAVAAAAPAAASGDRIVLHSKAYANPVGAPIRFDCLASPALVGKTASIKQVGGPVQGSVKVKANGSCDISATPSGKGEHQFVVVISYKTPSGGMKTVTSNVEDALSGKDTS